MWKKILKARTREEDYARLVELLDKILAGEVEPLMVSPELFSVLYDFGLYKIVLRPNDPVPKNTIDLTPKSPHDEFIIRLYLEEYRDNMPRLRNLVKKLVYKEEDKLADGSLEYYQKLITILDLIILEIIETVAPIIAQDNNYTRPFKYVTELRKKFSFKFGASQFRSYALNYPNASITKAWSKIVAAYITRLKSILPVTTYSESQLRQYHLFLFNSFSKYIADTDQGIEEVPTIYETKGQNLDELRNDILNENFIQIFRANIGKKDDDDDEDDIAALFA